MSDPLVCSFCGIGKEPTRELIIGPGVNICAACVSLCNQMLSQVVVPDGVSRRPLTRRQYGIYSYLAAYIKANGFAPSFAEIASNFAYKSLATVHEHLTAIERKGWITRTYNESRAIVLRGAA